MTESNLEFLESVSERIAGRILGFCASRVGKEFHADDLRQHVGDCAPGSADRVLRLLRQTERLDYVVLNRRKSLYRVEWVLAA